MSRKEENDHQVKQGGCKESKRAETTPRTQRCRRHPEDRGCEYGVKDMGNQKQPGEDIEGVERNIQFFCEMEPEGGWSQKNIYERAHSQIAYHKVRESVAQGTLQVAHEKEVINLANVLTKFSGPLAFKKLVHCILFR